MNVTANAVAAIIAVIAVRANPGAVLSAKVISSNIFAVTVAPALANPGPYSVSVYGRTKQEVNNDWSDTEHEGHNHWPELEVKTILKRKNSCVLEFLREDNLETQEILAHRIEPLCFLGKKKLFCFTTIFLSPKLIPSDLRS